MGGDEKDLMRTNISIITMLVLTELIISGCSPIATQPTAVVSEAPATTVPAIPSPTSTTTVEIMTTATLASSVAAPKPTAGTPLYLEGQTWLLASYVDAGGVQKTPLENTQVSATFENGNVVGNSSCNSYFASYQLNGDNLTISNAGSTMMACLTSGVMIQETAYLEDLQKSASFQITAGQLEIADAQGKMILVFNANPQTVQATVIVQTLAAQASLSLDSLKNMDFRNGFTVSGRAPLSMADIAIQALRDRLQRQ
jgi:heat shock protein HslJ